MTIRFCYASGYKSKDDAESALYDMYASGEVAAGEHPEVKRRTHKDRTIRFDIWVDR